jgi:hypothetical protein
MRLVLEQAISQIVVYEQNYTSYWVVEAMEAYLPLGWLIVVQLFDALSAAYFTKQEFLTIYKEADAETLKTVSRPHATLQWRTVFFFFLCCL